MDNIPQATAGCDSFKQGTDMVVLASQEDHCGAAGQDGFEVTSAKTSYKVVTGDQVRGNLSMIPDQSLFLYLNNIFAFSHQTIYHSPRRITGPRQIPIDPNSAEERFHTLQDHRCL